MQFYAISEAMPADKWMSRFRESWPRYREWYLSEGLERRPSIDEARTAISLHMPELLSVYDRVCGLVEDTVAQRALSLYRMPPVISGCSVAVAPGDEPVLVRNYDFGPHFFEGTVWKSRWFGHDVIATSEAWLGCLDGVNSEGLAAALTFGGRAAYGEDGFQTPLLLRYVLETCSTTAEAVRALRRLPAQMANNVVLMDRSGAYAVVYLSPDREAEVRSAPVATNHQLTLEWPEHNQWAETTERMDRLVQLRAEAPGLEAFVEEFHQPPLHRTAYSEGLGTLYTAVIRPCSGSVEYRWPNKAPWLQSIDEFSEGVRELPV